MPDSRSSNGIFTQPTLRTVAWEPTWHLANAYDHGPATTIDGIPHGNKEMHEGVIVSRLREKNQRCRELQRSIEGLRYETLNAEMHDNDHQLALRLVAEAQQVLHGAVLHAKATEEKLKQIQRQKHRLRAKECKLLRLQGEMSEMRSQLEID